MSDRSKSEDAKGQEEAVEPQDTPAPSQEPTTTPNTPPLPRETGSSEADPAGIDNTHDHGPA